MRFQHITYRVENNENATGYSPVYIFLDDDKMEDDVAKAIARAIALDIRGDYGFFLNRSDERDEKTEYEWQGNQYRIKVNHESGIVNIVNILDEEEREFSTKLHEWYEALQDWKGFYLSELGFRVSRYEAFNHMFGVLILAYDLIGDSSIYNDNRGYKEEVLNEAIKKCADRFGVKESTVYRDCRNVTGLYSISDFYKWTIRLFRKRKCEYEHEYEYGLTLDKFVQEHLRYWINEKGQFKDLLRKHIGIMICDC